MLIVKKGSSIFLLGGILFFLPLILIAKDTEKELLKRLSQVQGAEHTAVLLQLAEYYWGVDKPEKADIHFRKTVAEARKGNDSKLLGDALFSFGRYLYYKSIPDSALRYLDESLKIRSGLGDSSGIGKCLSHMGLAYMQLKQFPEAYRYLQKALAVQRKIGDRIEQGKILTNLGNLDRDQCVYERALEYYLEALNLYYEVEDLEGIAWLNFSIGALYRNLKDYAQSLKYLNEAYKYYKQIAGVNENTGGIRICLSLLGDVYRLSGDYQRALQYLEKALELQQRSGVPIAVAHGMRRLAQVYYGMGEYEKALAYAQQSLAIQEQQTEKSGLPEIYVVLANTYLRLDNRQQAYYHLLQGLHKARQYKAKLIEGELLKTFADYHLKYNQPDSAYYYLSQYINLREQIFNEEVSSRIAALQVQYQLSQEEMRTTQLQQDVQIKELEIKRQTIWRNFMSITAGLAFVLVALLVILYTIKIRDNRTIREAMAKIKTLSGLIPICSHCKKIRNDQGYYEQLEKYIQEHSEVVFTHGICPDCAEKYYSQYLKKKSGNEPKESDKSS
jgi:tetratricopeptide (TPR) repeat protein